MLPLQHTQVIQMYFTPNTHLGVQMTTIFIID